MTFLTFLHSFDDTNKFCKMNLRLIDLLVQMFFAAHAQNSLCALSNTWPTSDDNCSLIPHISAPPAHGQLSTKGWQCGCCPSPDSLQRLPRSISAPQTHSDVLLIKGPDSAAADEQQSDRVTDTVGVMKARQGPRLPRLDNLRCNCHDQKILKDASLIALYC